MRQQFKYFAFISYNSKDTEWGKRVQRKLEHYRMPATLCSEHGWKRTPIKPVFFAPTDIQPGGLTEELQERLRASRNLIVICSPNSAKSEWVGKEIEFFHHLGRTKQIHFFIVDGAPHSGNPDKECFNPIVESLGLPEILGANINEQNLTYPFTNIPCPWLNKQRAYVQLISKLLDVEFDAIWQRHKRQLALKIISWILGGILVLTALLGIYITNQPVDVKVHLNEMSFHNTNLPPLHDAIITMTLENETKTDTIYSYGAVTLFKNIPHRYTNKYAHVHVECRDFLTVDTTIMLSKAVIVNIHRDSVVYGKLRFFLWNPDTEQTAPNTEIFIDGHKVMSDAEGYVSLTIPLADQKTSYPIAAKTLLFEDSIVYAPCGSHDAIIFKN